MSRNNRELSQFSAYLSIRDAGSDPGDPSQYDGIISLGATEFTGFPIPPAIGVGVSNPLSRLHVSVGTTDVIISGDPTLGGGGVLLDGQLVSKSTGSFEGDLTTKSALNVLIGNASFGSNVSLSNTAGVTTDPSLDITGYTVTIDDSSLLVNSRIVSSGENLFTGISTFQNKVKVELPGESGISTDIFSGALVVEGGVGISGTANIPYLNTTILNIDPDPEVGSVYIGPTVNTDIDGQIVLSYLFVENGSQFAGITTVNAPLYVTNFDDANDLVTGALQVSGGAAIGSQLRVGTGLSVAGSAEISNGLYVYNGQTYLYSPLTRFGSSSSDLVQFNSQIDSSIIPDQDAVYDLGTTLLRWNNIRGSNITVDTVGTDTLVASGNVTIGGSITGTDGIFVAGTESVFDAGVRFNTYASAEILQVTGTGYFNNDIVGTALTTRRAIAVDVSVASTSNPYYLTFAQSFVPSQEQTLFVSQNTNVNPITGDVSFGGNIALGGNSFDSISGTIDVFNLLNNNVSSVLGFSSALSVSLGTTVGYTTISSSEVFLQANSLKLGIGETSAIKGSNGFENITITGNTLTEFAGDISINGTTFDVNNGNFYLADNGATNISAFGFASEVLIGSDSVGFTSIRNPLFITAGDVRINGDQIQASTGDVNIDMTGADLTRFAGDIQIDGGDILVGGGYTHITMIGQQKAIFVGDIQIGGNDILASDGNVNISMASSSRTSIVGQLRVESNQITDGTDHINITLGSNYVQFTDDIRINGDSIRASDNTINITLESEDRTILAGVLQLGLNIIEASDGVEAIEVVPVSGDVGIKSDLIVENDVYVKGSDFIIRSDSVQIRDKLISIGLGIDTTSQVALRTPEEDDNKDVGVIFNYYDGVARQAAVFWDDSRSSVGIASVVTESSDVLTVTGYAKIDVNNITVHDCAGTSDLLSCDSETSLRTLINVVIDGGEY